MTLRNGPIHGQLVHFRLVTRPLIRSDGSYDRRKIFIRARLGAVQGLTWSEALKDAWRLARNQRQLAQFGAFEPNKKVA